MRRAFLAVWIILFGCVAVEIALRLRLGANVFSVADWRGEPVTILETGGAAPDPMLGWRQAANFTSTGFNTMQYGIRKNSAADERPDQGSIIAVGDSYTVGSQVLDTETWPAQIERLTGARVLNAGVGGYGVDQSALFAEQLVKALKPRHVIVGMQEESILRANYSSYNMPKPYFVEDDGSWRLRNQPVPPKPPVAPEPFYRLALARSIAAHSFFSRYAPDWWFTTRGLRFERVSPITGRAACHALERLKASLDGIEATIVVQYAGGTYWRGRSRQRYTEEAIVCAYNLGYSVVDEFPVFSDIAATSIVKLKEHYVMSGNNAVFGHLSPLGNSIIAGLVAAGLK